MVVHNSRINSLMARTVGIGSRQSLVQHFHVYHQTITGHQTESHTEHNQEGESSNNSNDPLSQKLATQVLPLPLFPRAELLTWFSRPTTKCICFAVFLSQLIVFVARTYAHHLLSISHGTTAQLFADNILLVTKTKTRRHYLDDERLKT